MKDESDSDSSTGARSTALRTAVTLTGVAILLLIAFFWFQSYFIGRWWYRSTWRGTETAAAERASWLYSNYGSFAIAWRRQDGNLGNPLPEDANETSRFPASQSALGHIHPEGIWSWHWIHRRSTPTAMVGAVRHDYGHLFIPYWMPFLLFLFLVAFVNVSGERERRSVLPSNLDDPGDNPSRGAPAESKINDDDRSPS